MFYMFNREFIKKEITNDKVVLHVCKGFVDIKKIEVNGENKNFSFETVNQMTTVTFEEDLNGETALIYYECI